MKNIFDYLIINIKYNNHNYNLYEKFDIYHSNCWGILPSIL